ncbi:DoxX family protein [Rhizobium sp. KVB221]|uniref:DoxX family protein n=1 Tax=Rhizobium setariae TaxID=2801340 RepID=A0A936YKS7_9HYPH|nr:DoxX family protein [Rhizobium setariae]MBL0372088.1 DoxX family protein [Rhizobium setariae]
METLVLSTAPGRGAKIAGWVLSGLLIAFLVFDGAIKLVPLQVVLDTMAPLGYAPDVATARVLGILTLACTILYAIPRTSVLGAILLTGYLGGAMATHFRIGNPVPTHTLFGLYLGVIAWGGLYLRYPWLRRIIPIKL